MAKGYRGGAMPGGINMNAIKKMQQDMVKLQEEVEAQTFSSTSGGGMVTASVNGKRELTELNINPEAIDPEDIEMLQDMIIAAVNESLRKAEDAMSSSMSKFTGGMGLGGLL